MGTYYGDNGNNTFWDYDYEGDVYHGYGGNDKFWFNLNAVGEAYGGTGDDIYYLGDPNAISLVGIHEYSGGGNDTVYFIGDEIQDGGKYEFSLPDNVEALYNDWYYSNYTYSLTIYGNDYDNLISSNATVYDISSARQAADTAAGRLEVVIALSRTFRQITQVAIIGFSAWLAIESSLTAGGVIASSILLGRALAPFDQLIAGWRQLVAARDARRRLSELLKQSDKHIERSSLPPPSGELSVQRLTLRSPAGNNRWLLQDVSFRAQPGRGVGIIGPSGAGKTTLCRAAAGLVAPDIGEIRLDGARLDMWESDELGRYLGYLQQDVGLPPATVAQTIARLQRNADPELIHAAARAAGAHELILELPSGYDTPVGTGGVPISGGQRQRIGLARALYGNPVLIILDEPDAHLDHAGEEALRSAIINAKQRGAAVVLVAQRPAMIALMDDVVVLQNGKVTQFGPRVEVLRTAMRKEQSP